MKSISKLTVLTLAFLVLAASTFAQEPSPREQFQTAVAAYQKSATEENALKLADLYKQLDPPPAIPPDAEYHAQKGAAFAELAKEPADFQRAVAEFEQAIQLAPWVGEYHYNTALMLKSKGGTSDLEAAMDSIKLARLFAKDDKEKRDATAMSAKLEVALEVTKESVAKEANLADAKKAEEEKAAAANRQAEIEKARRPNFKGIWTRSRDNSDTPGTQVSMNSAIEIIEGSPGQWKVGHIFTSEGPAPADFSNAKSASNVKIIGRELTFSISFASSGTASGDLGYSLTLSEDGSQLTGHWVFTQYDTSRGLVFWAQRGRVPVVFVR
jgi:tetratricopeptide (TPR) repeat protein